MEIGADGQRWGPDASATGTITVLQAEGEVAKTEKDKSDEMPPEIRLVPTRLKRRKTGIANRKTPRKMIYHESFGFAADAMDGNALVGTTLE